MPHLSSCVCDECFGACDEANPTCGECFLCEARADDETWWTVNRADILGI